MVSLLIASPRSRGQDHEAGYPPVGILAATPGGTGPRPACYSRLTGLAGVGQETGYLFLGGQCHGNHGGPHRHHRSDSLDHIFGTYLFARFFTRPPDNLGTRRSTQLLQSNLVAPISLMSLPEGV